MTGTLTIRAIHGRTVSARQPNDGEILTWVERTQEWTPETFLVPKYQPGQGIAMMGAVIAVDSAIIPIYSLGTGQPTQPCLPGRDFYTDTASGTLYFCRLRDVWEGASRLVFTSATPTLQLGAASVAYFWPSNQSTANAVRASREVLMPVGCTMRNLFVRTGSLQYASGAVHIRLQRNGTVTPLQVSIAANSPTGTYSNTNAAVRFEPGDVAVLELQNTSPSQSSARLGQISVVCN